MTTTDSDPCARPRAALNKAEQDLMAHREAHGEPDDDQGAGWAGDRQRLLAAVTSAIASYEDCVRANDPLLPERPDIAADFSAMSRMRNSEDRGVDDRADDDRADDDPAADDPAADDRAADDRAAEGTPTGSETADGTTAGRHAVDSQQADR